jgi:hypothetical protein
MIVKYEYEDFPFDDGDNINVNGQTKPTRTTYN